MVELVLDVAVSVVVVVSVGAGVDVELVGGVEVGGTDVLELLADVGGCVWVLLEVLVVVGGVHGGVQVEVGDSHGGVVVVVVTGAWVVTAGCEVWAAVTPLVVTGRVGIDVPARLTRGPVPLPVGSGTAVVLVVPAAAGRVVATAVEDSPSVVSGTAGMVAPCCSTRATPPRETPLPTTFHTRKPRTAAPSRAPAAVRVRCIRTRSRIRTSVRAPGPVLSSISQDPPIGDGQVS